MKKNEIFWLFFIKISFAINCLSLILSYEEKHISLTEMIVEYYIFIWLIKKLNNLYKKINTLNFKLCTKGIKFFRGSPSKTRATIDFLILLHTIYNIQKISNSNKRYIFWTKLLIEVNLFITIHLLYQVFNWGELNCNNKIISFKLWIFLQ